MLLCFFGEIRVSNYDEEIRKMFYLLSVTIFKVTILF